MKVGTFKTWKDYAGVLTTSPFESAMSRFERLLVPGSTEKPTCRCGEVMEVASIERLPEGSDAAVRVYQYCVSP
jgi:hypothetical protein